MREARLVMADLAASGLSPDQLALVMELTAALAAQTPPAKSKGALRTQRWRDRNASQNVTERNDETECDAKEIPPDPHKKTLTPNKPKGLAPKRGTRLPDDFAIPEDWISWAMSRRRWTKAVAMVEAEKFCRHFQNKTGKGSTALNWFKAFQNWVDSSYRPDGDPPAANGKERPLSIEELKRAIQFNEDHGNHDKAKIYRFQLEARQSLARAQ